MAKARSRRASNVEATRAALLNVARKHFAREGYSRAEIGRIAAEAGVTTGALYHHFAGKKALFQAVAEGMEAEILAAAAAIAESDPWRRLGAAFAALIDVGAAADVQRIILGELQSAAVIKPYPIDLIARTLLAVLREAAAEVARSKHDPKVRAQVAELVDGVLEVLAVQ
jgi:AcrR family transcriptional regulator